MNRDELFDILMPIVIQATGVPKCILADPNHKAPRGEYCTIEPEASVTEFGHAIIQSTGNNVYGIVDTVVRTQLITQCEINFYRGDARTRAKRLMNANKRPSISNMLRMGSVGWQRTNAVIDLTALQADQREQRASISVFLMYEEITDVEESNGIEQVSWYVEDHTGVEIDAGVEIIPEPSVIPANALLFNGVALTYNGKYLTFEG